MGRGSPEPARLRWPPLDRHATARLAVTGSMTLRPPMSAATGAGLIVENLILRLPPGADRPLALDGVSLHVDPGEVLCLVGESGSGKSLLAAAVLRLLPPGVTVAGGRVALGGTNLLSLPERDMRRIRGARVAMVFQDPSTALNPLHRVGDQVAEPFRTHTDLSRAAVQTRVLDLLAQVGLPDPAGAAAAYPHQLSGGQRQRVAIATALALEPDVLIADEPTTALDVTTQAQVLALMRDLQRRRGMALLFVTHDFGVVAEIADRVAVLQRGVLVEHGPAQQVLNHPAHPYTRALIAAVPPLAPAAPRPVSSEAILVAEGLTKTYRAGRFSRRAPVQALDRVSVTLPRGGTLGVVGESGSGKSTLARVLLRLLPPDAGTVRLDGVDLLHLPRREAAQRIGMVFQDPYASLNPRRRVGDLVAQGPMLHGMARGPAFALARDLLAQVALDPAAADRFPHEFSGGQRQRIALARALALQPAVLVADEPVSALDVSVQAQVLALLAELRTRLGLSVVFVTHDLRVAGRICDRVAVMRRGVVVEEGTTEQVFLRPQHEYTQALLAAVPGRGWTPPQTPVAPAPT